MVLLVLLVLPVLRVSRVFAVKAENLVPLVLPVVLDPVVFLDFLAKMVMPEKMVNLVLLDPLAQLVLVVCPVCLVFQVLRATVVSPVWMALKVNLVLAVKRDRKSVV